MTAKIRIDVKSGIIELKGSEDFVIKYLEEFKSLDIMIRPIRETYGS